MFNVPIVTIQCSSLEHISNGGVELSEGRRMARYSCNSYFSLKGPAERICQQNGEWSNWEPLCGEDI